MDSPEQHIRRRVVAQMGRCSVCHRSFHEDDVEVLSRQSNAWMMLVQCDDCHARTIVAAQDAGQHDLSEIENQLFAYAKESIPFDTDQMSDLAERDFEGDPVSTDDLLELHDFLESFDGDFRGLFSRS